MSRVKLIIHSLIVCNHAKTDKIVYVKILITGNH